MGSAEKNTALRAGIIRRRAQLSSWQQRRAADAVTRRIAPLSIFQQSRNVALYCAGKGELDTYRLRRLVLRRRGSCFLPVITGASSMDFVSHRAGMGIVQNRYGLDQPGPGARKVGVDDLDLVIVPLVAFDTTGNRLGMGGGFYDRYFSQKISRPGSGPFLLGVAYDFQLVETLQQRDWDVPMDMVVTPGKSYRWTPRIRGKA